MTSQPDSGSDSGTRGTAANETETAAEYNARFDPANEAGQEAFSYGFKCGWLLARYPDNWDDEAEEDYRRSVDGVELGEAWEAHRDAFFARLPLAAVKASPTPAWLPVEGGDDVIERVARAIDPVAMSYAESPPPFTVDEALHRSAMRLRKADATTKAIAAIEALRASQPLPSRLAL